MGLREKTRQESMKVVTAHQDRLATEPNYELPTHYEDDHRIELDVIEQLKSNIAMLDDLQKRLHFINNELETIIRRK